MASRWEVEEDSTASATTNYLNKQVLEWKNERKTKQLYLVEINPK
jgi:hypothetical protein